MYIFIKLELLHREFFHLALHHKRLSSLNRLKKSILCWKCNPGLYVSRAGTRALSPAQHWSLPFSLHPCPKGGPDALAPAASSRPPPSAVHISTLALSSSFPPSQLPVPLECFTEPAEDSLPLLQLYFRALVTGALRPHWCPVLYAVAVAHVNSFIFSQDPKSSVRPISVFKEWEGSQWSSWGGGES